MTAPDEYRLGDLSGTINVTRGFPTQRTTSGGAIPVLSVAALRNASPPKYFAERDDLLEVGLDIARMGDVLVAVEGGTVAETFIVPEGIDKFVPSQQVATLRVVDLSKVDPWYLGAWLSTPAAREQLRRLARGVAIQRIPIKDLGSVVLPVPPLQVQRDIGERFRAFESAIQAHRTVIDCLRELRDLDLVVELTNRASTFSDSDVRA